MTEHLTADEAAARIHSVDTVGMPLGPGQPPGLLEAMGRRTDWEDLRINGALLSVFDAGVVITTPRHQVDLIITEHGVAELQGKTVHQRGEVLAAIAHPAFREGLREAAERASHGRAPFPA